MTADFPLKRLPYPVVVHDRGAPDAVCTSVRQYQLGCWSVVELAGDVDVQSASVLRPLSPAGGVDVVFDLRGVTFMDCAGLRAVLSTCRAVQSAGGWVRVVVSSHAVRKLFMLSRADHEVSLFDSLAEALFAPVSPPPSGR